MPRVGPIALEARERASLEAICKKGSAWRERDQVETILRLAAGEGVRAVATGQGLCCKAVRERRRKWRTYGFANLPDRLRSGAPSKLTDTHRHQVGQWVEQEALLSRELLTRLEHDYGVVIGRTTLCPELKGLASVWQRTCYSLKKTGPGAIRANSGRSET